METLPPDPIPSLITEILAMENMHQDTRQLTEMAIEAQRTGQMPAIPANITQQTPLDFHATRPPE